MAALGCAWCSAFPKGTNSLAVFPGCCLSVLQAKGRGGGWKLLPTGILSMLLALAGRAAFPWVGKESCKPVLSPRPSPWLCLASEWGDAPTPWPGKVVPAVWPSGLPSATPDQAGDETFCFRARKRHCSELWRCPWQSQHAARRSHPGTTRGHVVSCPEPACERCLGQHHVALG